MDAETARHVWTVVAYLLGVVTTAIATQLIRRFVDRPRLVVAITSIAFSCSRDRHRKLLAMPNDLRQLLLKWPIRGIEWNAEHFSEYELDLAVLDTLRAENRLATAANDLDRLLHLLGIDVRHAVYQFACNANSLTIARNALVEFEDRAPKIPTPAPDPATAVFPLVEMPKKEGDQTRMLTKLMLPGNPLPVVGSLEGNPAAHMKMKALPYALSYCDSHMLNAILKLGVEYATLGLSQYRAVRDALLRVKKSNCHLVVDLLLTNVGKEPTVVSSQATFHVAGRYQIPVHLAHLVGDDGGDPENTLRDLASRLRQEGTAHDDLLRQYETSSSHLPVAAGQTIHARFVSPSTLSPQEKSAAEAARSGNAQCDISVRQANPRAMTIYRRWMARFAPTRRPEADRAF